MSQSGGVGISFRKRFAGFVECELRYVPDCTEGIFPGPLDDNVCELRFLPVLRVAVGVGGGEEGGEFVGVIHTSSLPDIESRLAELVFPDTLSLQECWSIISDTLEVFSTSLPSHEPSNSLAPSANPSTAASATPQLRR